MKNFRFATLLLTVLLIMAGVVSADEQNKKTIFTFKDSVQVPGQVLPAGTYVFKLANSDSNRHIVQIYNQDETKLITTILAVPNYQLQPSGETIVTYAKAPANQPTALEAWFYPGDNFGQQFVYPEGVATELSTLNTLKVPTTGSEQAYPNPTSDTSAATTSSTTTATATSTPATTDNSTAAASTPSSTTSTPATTDNMNSAKPRTDDTTAANMNKPATSSTMSNSTTSGTSAYNSQNANTQTSSDSQNLPQTASTLPLAGLIGFLSIGAAVVLRKLAAL